MKLMPFFEPLKEYDATEAIRAVHKLDQSCKMWHLWPLRIAVTTFDSGSKNYVLEIRPMMKFSITIGFFWKR